MRRAMRRAMRRDETFHVWTTGSRTGSRSATEVYRSPDCPSIDDRTKLHFLSSGLSAFLLIIERIRQTRFPCAQTNIATHCLLYLSFDMFSEGYCRSDEELELRMQKYAFLEYAAQNWGAHARGHPEEVIKEV